MSADIEKLIRHNEELLNIKKELRNKGFLSNSSRYLNSSTNYLNSNHLNTDNEQPKPLLFVSSIFFQSFRLEETNLS